MNALIKILASGFGSGYSPVASGTAGSLVAVLIYWFLLPYSVPLTIAVVALTFLICVPVCGKAEELYGKKDDGHIVLDEFIGMWVSLFFIPHSVKLYVIAFFLFRILDVIKPFFVRRVQEWRGGWGVVADDFFAGIFANLILRALMLLVNLQ